MTGNNSVTEDENEKLFEFYYSEKNVYNDPNILMVSWWVIYSYFNNEWIQIGDIEIMTGANGSSGSFGSRVSSKSIGYNTYTGRRGNFHSKPTSIHGPIHKYDFNY